MITAHQVLTLAEALQQWGHPHLVLQVMEWEPKCSASEAESLRRIHLTHRAFRRDETNTTAAGNPFIRLRLAWEDLETDFRRRIEQKLIYLCGVQMAPERHTDPEIIPGVWAGEFQFDFLRGNIAIGELRFTAVACSLDPWKPDTQQAPEPAPATAQMSTYDPIADAISMLRPEGVPALSYETILALLQEHAQCVIKDGRQLSASGKESLLPIVRSKMESRAAAGEMCHTLDDEARFLANWIKQKAPNFQSPAAKTISRRLSTIYNLLKPRSTPAIQKAKI